MVSEYTIFNCNIYKRPLLYASVYVTFSRNDETGKLKKVQYIVKHFSGQFLFYCMPKREVSIDECLIGCVRFEPQQFNICPIIIIRILVSNVFAYVRVIQARQ